MTYCTLFLTKNDSVLIEICIQLLKLGTNYQSYNGMCKFNDRQSAEIYTY